MQTPAEAVAPAKSPIHLGVRLAVVVAILFADKLILNQFMDFDAAQSAHGFGVAIRLLQHWGLRFLAAFAGALWLFAQVRGGRPLRAAAAAILSAPVQARWLLIHALLLIGAVPLSYYLFRDSPVPIEVLGTLLLLSALGAALSAALAIIPGSLWVLLARALGSIWLYALVTAAVATGAMQLLQALWTPTAVFTFSLVDDVLRGFIPNLSVDPATRIMQGEHFSVFVSDDCSGLEGVGLVVTFLAAWLVYFRREYRFPQALLLIPVGVAIIFALNVMRIAGLMLIGESGHPEVAIYGFHSQAGWLAFNLVACGLAYLSRRSVWLNSDAAAPKAAANSSAGNPTAVFLMPFLAILGAGFVSHAISGRFESFYPLRLAAALGVLWYLRGHLKAMQWRFTWQGLAMGVGVCVLWWLYSRFTLPQTSLPATLAAMPWGLRLIWISCRVLTAVLIVPLAEELAFRGYLMRRLQSAEFESLPYHEVRWPALVVSAIAFGAMHGAMWLPGIAAGLAYGFIAIRRGSLGDAVLAHAVTNGIIALCVLTSADWRLW